MKQKSTFKGGLLCVLALSLFSFYFVNTRPAVTSGVVLPVTEATQAAEKVALAEDEEEQPTVDVSVIGKAVLFLEKVLHFNF